MLARQSQDCVLSGLRVAALGGAGGVDEGVGRARRCRDDDDALASCALHDLGDTQESGG